MSRDAVLVIVPKRAFPNGLIAKPPSSVRYAGLLLVVMRRRDDSGMQESMLLRQVRTEGQANIDFAGCNVGESGADRRHQRLRGEAVAHGLLEVRILRRRRSLAIHQLGGAVYGRKILLLPSAHWTSGWKSEKTPSGLGFHTHACR